MPWPKDKRLLMAVAACGAAGALISALFLHLFTARPPIGDWLLFSLVLLAVLGLGGLAVARMAETPVRRSRQAIQGLKEGNYADRLYVTRVDDEPGRLALEINALLDRMEEAMSRQRQFVSAISHDLRTPLTIMKGDIEVALMRPRAPEEYVEILGSNLEEVERTQRLVDDLVTLARADYGDLSLNMRNVALGSLVAEVRESFVEPARRKQLTFESYLEGDVHIEGDQPRLKQLLHNLLDNAVHYTPSGGKIELALLSSRDRDEVLITVRDTGIGIAPRDLPHIFEPFYRGTPSRRTQHDGYGLGLAICDHIVRAHGGKISVESRQGPGSGTTFSVHLPRRRRPGW